MAEWTSAIPDRGLHQRKLAVPGRRPAGRALLDPGLHPSSKPHPSARRVPKIVRYLLLNVQDVHLNKSRMRVPTFFRSSVRLGLEVLP